MRCNLCELSKTCNSVKIEGRGSETPTYLFIGEAPGEVEDSRNLPFVGPAGSLLVQAIKEYDLKPARLSNTVRCRPPNNREPKPGEIEKCRPYLLQEIEQYKPKVIVACGNVALRALTGKNGVLKHAGRVVGELNGTKIFSIYHPSYVLRYPQNGHKWEMQMKELKKITEGTLDSKVKVEIVGIKDAIKKVEASQEHFVTFDFETTGAYKPFGGSLRCVGFHTSEETFVAELDYSKDCSFMLSRLAITGIKKCAHNSLFERRWFLDESQLDPKNLVYDTMLFHYLLDENKPHDLESVAQEMCDASPWKIEHEMQEKGQTWATVPFETLAQYCGRDAYYTHQIMKKFIKKFKEDEGLKGVLEYYKKVLLPTSALCAQFESRGMKVDSDWCQKIDSKYAKENVALYEKIKALPKVVEYIQERKDQAKKKPFELNLSSPDQVREIICTKLGIKVKGMTDGGAPSVNYDSLLPFQKKSKFISLYMDWKEKETMRNNFLKKFPKFADAKGLIHASFNPAFQVTGRISVSRPPCSNIPREQEVRGMITSRFKGGHILSCDYKQLEMRLLASEANEKKMLEIFQKGWDVHDETAKEMFGEGFTKEQRDISKNINFGTVYGIEEWSFSKKFHVSVENAERWLGQHRELYPEIYKWMEAQHASIKKHGYSDSRFGLRRRLPGATTADPESVKRLLRQAGNFPIQSQGASITNLAGVEFEKELEKMVEYQSKFYHIVHDNLVIDCFPGEEEDMKALATKIMQVKVVEQCPWLKVALPVDTKLSFRWGGAE